MRHVGWFYVTGELGYIGARTRSYVDQEGMPAGGTTNHGYSGYMGIGYKANGRLDVGIGTMFPLLGMQVHFGVDFGSF